MVSHPGKTTNPFDIAFESDVDANDMVSLFLWFTIVLIITLVRNYVPYTVIYDLLYYWWDGSICGPAKYMLIWIGAQNERANCIKSAYDASNRYCKNYNLQIWVLYSPYTSPPKSNSKH